MSDEQAQREMTLAEWVGRLYEGHTARVELASLERELAEARKELAQQYTLRAKYADAVETALRRAEQAEAKMARMAEQETVIADILNRAVGDRDESLADGVARLERELAEARERIYADNAVCICGCPADEHEVCDEDGGESCANGSHTRLRVCAAVAQEFAAARAEVETVRLQLAACGVAAMQNTEASITERITRDNPYWSASYGDVCAAVDREMAHRAEVERLRESVESVAMGLGQSRVDRIAELEEHEKTLTVFANAALEHQRQAEAEVERAARWFFAWGYASRCDDEEGGTGETFDAAWSRYQQERQG